MVHPDERVRLPMHDRVFGTSTVRRWYVIGPFTILSADYADDTDALMTKLK
jgi:hypothetical protein